jgi:hypothetical protein
MWLYTFGNAIEDERNGQVTQMSLGNYGFTMYKCFTQYYQLKSQNHISCPRGKIMSELVHIGMVPDIHPLSTVDGQMIGNDYCGAWENLSTSVKCGQFINTANLNTFWDNSCKGNDWCHVDMITYLKDMTLAPQECKSMFTKLYV